MILAWVDEDGVAAGAAVATAVEGGIGLVREFIRGGLEAMVVGELELKDDIVGVIDLVDPAKRVFNIRTWV